MTSNSGATQTWPPLPVRDWKETYRTVHMWTQMVGKVRVALAPPTNHFWDTTLHVTARGLTTTPMSCEGEIFEITFDFVDHVLRIDLARGARRELPLEPQPVAQFYERLTTALRELGLEVRIWPMPVEVPDPVRFTADTSGAYDAASANRFWRILGQVDAILKEFRSRFVGKCSPVHFFWGSFDLAVTRFSGRPAPPRPGADPVTAEAYSHEVCSAGWWPGGGPLDGPAFYSYTAPEPAGLSQARIGPAGAFYSAEMKEFLYRYDDMLVAADPRAALLEFLQTTYEAGANLGQWDRPALERPAPL